MPPRIPILTCLRATNACSAARNGNSLILPLRPFSTSTPTQAKSSSSSKSKRRYRDPYALAQARARKAANITRQAVLTKERAEAFGDPARGKLTPFVESFDIGRDPSEDTLVRLDHFIKPDELEDQLEQSSSLMTPIPVSRDTPGYAEKTPEELEEINKDNVKRVHREHENVKEVMKRLLNLDNGSSKGRYRVNIQRCVETFGRHKTDEILPPKPRAIPISAFNSPEAAKAAIERLDREPREVVERKGPDTGSSEVQIAILTAKIRSLSNFLDTRGRKDKVGKRDLRLLVHRRQKLLKYLRKKERGGPRWQRCIETLGLTEATWTGEISL
ncbi:hypothetical protein EJ08DRAFT_650444 [Tothia fuscella]|uniref:30S ribosomal protein S15 n=1 Tax=Tothia fuscella TaxID=1048955 RepID=A0A9P4NP15_9PEZI|nr:hypothetical protein EJ08DRAFT_650444 [Tothia fuscella]